jgi:hypothetical protein
MLIGAQNRQSFFPPGTHQAGPPLSLVRRGAVLISQSTTAQAFQDRFSFFRHPRPGTLHPGTVPALQGDDGETEVEEFQDRFLLLR